MMNLTFLFLAFSLFTASFSFAEIGAVDAISHSGPPNICRILIGHNSQISLCSGSLVAADKILTAAHCVEQLKSKDTINVSCGYMGFDPRRKVERKSAAGNRIYVEGAQFAEQAKGISYDIHPQWKNGVEKYDVAVIHLDHPMKIQPMKVAKNIPLMTALECFSAGYGLDEHATMGRLNVGRINGTNLQMSYFLFTEESFVSKITNSHDQDPDMLETATMIKYFDKRSIKNSVTLYGDSGGPVYCRQIMDGQFFQVAINRALYYSLKKRPGTLIFDFLFTSGYSDIF